MKPRYEYRVFEHTADLGLEIRAPTPEELFAGAALAMSREMAGGPLPARGRVESISAEGYDPESLMVRWLGEWLALFDRSGRLPCGFVEIRVGAERVEARARTFSLAALRRPGGMGIKAVTYHGIEVRLSPGDCRARVVLDL